MLKLIKNKQGNFFSKLEKLLDKRKTLNNKVELKVKKILNDIKKNKDKALIKYERKYSRNKNIS